MFKNPFSFNGRIRRTEYAFSNIIYIITYLVIMGIVSSSHSLGVLVLILPMFWFMLAQGTKRCHDRGNSGWYQFIPFYRLWMLFANSQKGVNEYGKNPKGIGNEEVEEKETRG